MRAQNQFAVVQLKDEIRLLHQRIQAGRRSAEPASETWNRQDIDHRIDELLKQLGVLIGMAALIVAGGYLAFLKLLVFPPIVPCLVAFQGFPGNGCAWSCACY